jgi:hypothetical protein
LQFNGGMSGSRARRRGGHRGSGAMTAAATALLRAEVGDNVRTVGRLGQEGGRPSGPAQPVGLGRWWFLLGTLLRRESIKLEGTSGERGLVMLRPTGPNVLWSREGEMGWLGSLGWEKEEARAAMKDGLG